MDELSLDAPVKLAEGIYWVGFFEKEENVQCNPYLIVQGNSAVLIDGGSRSDFSTVMVKILQTGITPHDIIGLVYQHYDPDLCGSILSLVGMCNNPMLNIYTHSYESLFILFYLGKEKRYLIKPVDSIGYKLALNERELEFINIPYAHTRGTIVTYDKLTKTLFSSDLFGSFTTYGNLYADIDERCAECSDFKNCIKNEGNCPLRAILEFNAFVMPSRKSLNYALDKIRNLEINTIAPQHGYIIKGSVAINVVMNRLYELEEVGIDMF